MGVFDHLHDQEGIEWQTKDFERPNLDRYRISKSGRLERGTALYMPPKYAESSTELVALFERTSLCLERISLGEDLFDWKETQFSGKIHAIRCEAEGPLQEADFEFQNGLLLSASLSSPSA